MYYQSQLKWLLDEKNPSSVFGAVDPIPVNGAAGLTWLLFKGLEEDAENFQLNQRDDRVYDLMAEELTNGCYAVTERILELCPSYRSFLPRTDESLWSHAAEAGNVAGLEVLNRYQVSDVGGGNSGLIHSVKGIRPGALLYLCTRVEHTCSELLDALELAVHQLEDVRLFESIMGERLVLVLLLCIAKFHPNGMDLLDSCEGLEEYCCLEGMGELLDQLMDGKLPSGVYMNLLDHISAANADACADLLLNMYRFEREHPREGGLSMSQLELMENGKFIWAKDVLEEEQAAREQALWDGGRFSCLDGLKILKLSTELSRMGDEHDGLVRLTGTICALKGLHIPFPYQTYELIVNDRF